MFLLKLYYTLHKKAKTRAYKKYCVSYDELFGIILQWKVEYGIIIFGNKETNFMLIIDVEVKEKNGTKSTCNPFWRTCIAWEYS